VKICCRRAILHPATIDRVHGQLHQATTGRDHSRPGCRNGWLFDSRRSVHQKANRSTFYIEGQRPEFPEKTGLCRLRMGPRHASTALQNQLELCCGQRLEFLSYIYSEWRVSFVGNCRRNDLPSRKKLAWKSTQAFYLH